MNNAVFGMSLHTFFLLNIFTNVFFPGKTMQAKWKEMKMELVSCERSLQKMINKSTFQYCTYYTLFHERTVPAADQNASAAAHPPPTISFKRDQVVVQAPIESFYMRETVPFSRGKEYKYSENLNTVTLENKMITFDKPIYILVNTNFLKYII